MGLWRRVTNVVRRAALVGANGPFTMSVNPFTYIVIHVDGVVAGAAAVGTEQPWTDITNLNLTFNGSSIYNLNGVDARAALMALGWRVPYVVNHASATNGDVVRVSIVLPLSRRPFWLREGFPASRKGEVELSLSFAAEGATFQTRFFTIETVEVLDMVSQRFLKMVTNSRALTVGDPDFELPLGNDYAGILVFSPAVADAGIATGTIRTMKMLVDNVEHSVVNSRFEALRDMFERMPGPLDSFAFGSLPQLASYNYIDLDPLKDDEYLLPTLGRSSVKLRPEIDNAGTVRVVPVELVRVEVSQGTPAMA